MDLVAIKTIVNEFPAYGKLSEYIAQGTISVIHLNSSIWIDVQSKTFYSCFGANKWIASGADRNELKPSLHLHCVDMQIPALLELKSVRSPPWLPIENPTLQKLPFELLLPAAWPILWTPALLVSYSILSHLKSALMLDVIFVIGALISTVSEVSTTCEPSTPSFMSNVTVSIYY